MAIEEPKLDYRLDYWKPIGGGRITPCQKDDPELDRARIEVFGRHRVEVEIKLSDIPSGDVKRLHYRVERIEHLLQAAFFQGRCRQSAHIKNSMVVR